MFQTECAGCGLSVHDLPDDLGDREAVRDQFFEFADDGHLYCQGCVAAWGGDASWLTSGTKVANLAAEWIDPGP